MRKIKMPKTRAEFEHHLEEAFKAGCDWGYANEHTANLEKQSQIGADCWLGRISIEEANKARNKIIDDSWQYLLQKEV